MGISKAQESVLGFHRKHKFPVSINPGENPVTDLMRVNLIAEEGVAEFAMALAKRDLVLMADALGDLLYVTLGAAITYGIPLEEVFNEIHASNMSKAVRKEGDLRLRDKGSSYRPPDIHNILCITGRVTEDYKPGSKHDKDVPDIFDDPEVEVYVEEPLYEGDDSIEEKEKKGKPWQRVHVKWILGASSTKAFRDDNREGFFDYLDSLSGWVEKTAGPLPPHTTVEGNYERVWKAVTYLEGYYEAKGANPNDIDRLLSRYPKAGSTFIKLIDPQIIEVRKLTPQEIGVAEFRRAAAKDKLKVNLP